MSRDRSLELCAGDSGPELLRRAHDELGKERLTREIARLRAAAHPGVVPLLDHGEDHLTLGWVGGETLETARPGLAGAAAIAASLAATLADLHRIGIVHGRLEPSHVVIGARGHPHLCGLRGVDPDGVQPDPSDDVAALGRLLGRLLGTEAELEPIPDRRWRRRKWSGYETRALQTLVDHATDPDPAKRPSAADLATAITAVMPDAGFEAPVASEAPAPEATPEAIPDSVSEADAPTDPGASVRAPASDTEVADPPEPMSESPGAFGFEPNDPASDPFLELPPAPEPVVVPRPSAGTRRNPVLLLAAAATVLLGVGILRIASAGPSGESRSAPVRDGGGEASDGDRSPTPSEDCELDEGPDIDGDGCPDPVSIDGNEVIAAGRRYRVGDPGDRVRIADWTCTGAATAAVVRPATGEIFLFDEWAENAPLSVRAATIVADAVDVEPPEDGACEPRIRRRDGSVVGIDPKKAE